MRPLPPTLYEEEMLLLLEALTPPVARPQGAFNPEVLDTQKRAARAKTQLALSEIYEEQLLKPKEAYNPDEQAYGVVHPVSMVRRFLEKQNYLEKEDSRQQVLELLRFAFHEDRETGFATKEGMPLLVGQGSMLARMGRKPGEGPRFICMVEGDFSNMGGSNDAMEGVNNTPGRDNTDKLIRHISKDIVLKAFADVSDMKDHDAFQGVTDYDKVHTQAVRAGGDEGRLMVYGLRGDQVQAVLDQKVHPQVDHFAAEMGVHDAKHTKKGKLPGFGVSFAVAELDKEEPSRIRSAIEDKIKLIKTCDGMIRAGLMDTSAIDNYVEHTLKKEFEGESEKPGEAYFDKRRGELTKLLPIVQERWENLIAPGGAYHAEFEEFKNKGGTGDPKAFFNDIRDRHAPQRDARLTAMEMPPKEYTRSPYAEITLAAHTDNEAPEIRRMRRVLKAAGAFYAEQENLIGWSEETRRYDINPGTFVEGVVAGEDVRKIKMMFGMAQFMNAPDPVSRAKSPTYMLESATHMLNKEGGARVLHLELWNVNGMNAVSTDLADAAIRETNKYIRESLEEQNKHAAGLNPRDHIYHEGGGKFKILLNQSYTQEDAENIVHGVHKRMLERMAPKTTAEFAVTTYANPQSHGKDASLACIVELGGSQKVRMGSIPHPKNPKKTLGVGYYTEEIKRGADIIAAFEGITDRAEKASEAQVESRTNWTGQMAARSSQQAGVKK